jgi:NADPH:quinone reductase-like Zn-dependent oxidoreductase
VPPNLSLEEASTLGAALLTASLGIFSCLNIPLPNPDTPLPHATDSTGPWALVLGGASSVGFAAVQLLIVSGFRVVATCSERSKPGLEKLGVKCVSYALAQEEVIAQIVGVTGGGLECVFDAVGMNGEIVLPLLDAIERSAAVAGMQGKNKLAFTTTNAYAPIPAAESLVAKAIQLGPIGQPGPEASALNDTLSEYIPVLYKLLESGKVGVGSFQVKGEGIEEIPNAWEVQKSGNVVGKVVVKVAKE